MPFLAPYHDTSMQYFFDYGMVAIFSILNLPITNVPIGLNFNNIPMGLQVIGNLHCDYLTIKIAELLEEANLAFWTSPKII